MRAASFAIFRIEEKDISDVTEYVREKYDYYDLLRMTPANNYVMLVRGISFKKYDAIVDMFSVPISAFGKKLIDVYCGKELQPMASAIDIDEENLQYVFELVFSCKDQDRIVIERKEHATKNTGYRKYFTGEGLRWITVVDNPVFNPKIELTDIKDI